MNESWRARVCRTVLLVGGLCAGATASSGPVAPFVIDAYVIDSGGASTAGNSCSRLTSSIGQPASGFSLGGGFALSAGFQAIAAAGGDDVVYFDGFEGCQP